MAVVSQLIADSRPPFADFWLCGRSHVGPAGVGGGCLEDECRDGASADFKSLATSSVAAVIANADRKSIGPLLEIVGGAGPGASIDGPLHVSVFCNPVHLCRYGGC
jgi:hypothetical protein